MPIYRFEGMDASGSEVQDRIDAASEADAQRQLSARGYFVTRLREVGQGSVEGQSNAGRREVMPHADSAAPADDSATSLDAVRELGECGWIIEPTDTGGVRLRT